MFPSIEITPIGWLLLPLAVWFLLARPNLLYWCAIFFLPFSATAVLNVGSGESFSGLQAWMFFGALWLGRDVPTIMRARTQWYRQRLRSSVGKLFFFLLVVLLSLVMPVLIDGQLWIHSASFGSMESRALFFSMENVTQFLYLAFGVFFAIFVAARNMNLGQFKKTLRIFLQSSIFVSCWGLLQWGCYEFGMTYPSFLFNTNMNDAAMGYLAQFADLGITRISSVTTEPSMLAEYLLIVLVVALFGVLSEHPIISRWWDCLALLLAFLVLLLSTSSTAYIGLLLLLPVLAIALSFVEKLNWKQMILWIAPLLVLGVATYGRSSVVQYLTDELIVSKAGSYSGIERLDSVVLAGGYFLRYPILGVGWGSVTSHDLIFKLLANTGIAGLLAFGLFLKALSSGLWASAAVARGQAALSERGYWAVAMLVVCFILIITNIFTEFAYVFGHLWFVFGMSLAISSHQAFRARANLSQAQGVRA